MTAHQNTTLRTRLRPAFCAAVAWAAARWPGALPQWAGWLFVAGTVLFSGSLYTLALSGVRWLGAITPLGGVAFLVGWVCLALAARQGKHVRHHGPGTAHESP